MHSIISTAVSGCCLGVSGLRASSATTERSKGIGSGRVYSLTRGWKSRTGRGRVVRVSAVYDDEQLSGMHIAINTFRGLAMLTILWGIASSIWDKT